MFGVQNILVACPQHLSPVHGRPLYFFPIIFRKIFQNENRHNNRGGFSVATDIMKSFSSAIF